VDTQHFISVQMPERTRVLLLYADSFERGSATPLVNISKRSWVVEKPCIARCSTGSKKAQTLPPLKSTLAAGQATDQLEVDKLFTFVQTKQQPRRIWIVQCRRTRQILAFFIGDGSAKCCRRLWRKLPEAYQRCVSYSDFWRAYSCLPTTTHQMVGKETGHTAHIERLNNTLRQRISRLVRKKLSFSKREDMLNLHFKLFAYFYNLEHLSA